MDCLLLFVLFTQSRDLSHFILKVTHSLHLCFFSRRAKHWQHAVKRIYMRKREIKRM
jgi:hypothetical protein